MVAQTVRPAVWQQALLVVAHSVPACPRRQRLKILVAAAHLLPAAQQGHLVRRMATAVPSAQEPAAKEAQVAVPSAQAQRAGEPAVVPSAAVVAPWALERPWVAAAVSWGPVVVGPG